MTHIGLHRDVKAAAFVDDLSRTAEEMRRKQQAAEDVSGDVREQVNMQGRALVAMGDEIIKLKAALGTLAREASK